MSESSLLSAREQNETDVSVSYCYGYLKAVYKSLDKSLPYEKKIISPPPKQKKIDESSFFAVNKHIYNDADGIITDYSGDVMAEMDSYLIKPCDAEEEPLEFWKTHQRDYPMLARIARQYLSAPATSMASESTFSEARDVFDYKRSSLTPEHAEMLIFLNRNLKKLNFDY